MQNQATDLWPEEASEMYNLRDPRVKGQGQVRVGAQRHSQAASKGT